MHPRPSLDPVSRSQSVLKSIGKAATFTLDFVMPLVCVHCGDEGALLCDDCVASLKAPTRALCTKCGEPVVKSGMLCGECVVLPPPLDRLVPLFRYEGAIRSGIHALKYRDVRAIASALGALLAEASYLRTAEIDCVVSVPMHSKKLAERGYNQASLLAQNLSQKTEISFIADAVYKTRATPSQVDLTRQERLRSIRGAFDSKYDFTGAHVLIVDDVVTTGSTLMNCAAALKRANAKRVSAVALAKELLDHNSEEPTDMERS